MEQVSTPETADLIAHEKRQWSSILGTKVEIKPLPKVINSEVESKLNQYGFELVSLPVLNLVPQILERQNVDVYLQVLKRLYPNWKPYELLDVKDRRDPSIVRNLQRWYWQMVKDGKIDFPKLPSWVAIETTIKPEAGKKYPESVFTKDLGYPERFGAPGISLVRALNQNKTEILAKVGLSPTDAEVRLPGVLEENLFGNRWGWGASSTSELTSTVYRPNLGKPELLVIGSSEKGGVAHTFFTNPNLGRPDIGYRLTIVFK